jgi:large subunit ribosomal protein L32e
MPKKSSSGSRSKPKEQDPREITATLRDIPRRKKPNFTRRDSYRYDRVKASWRYPKGLDNKSRQKRKGTQIHPGVGYRNPKIIRGLHPSGLQYILVNNEKELEALDPDIQGVRIAKTVGMHKRISIQNRADELGLIIFNPSRITQFDEALIDDIDEEVPEEKKEKKKSKK